MHLLVMLISGLSELLSLGAVIPFLAILIDPNRLWQESLVRQFSFRFGYTEASQLILPATIFFILASVIAAFVRLMNLWINGRLSAAVGSDLSCEAYKRTLYQPYSVHVQRNSAEVINGATTQIASTVSALRSFLQLITAVIVTIALLAGLFLIDAYVATAAVAIFGSAYWILAVSARRNLRVNSYRIAESSSLMVKALQEGLGAIRDVLLDGNQDNYLRTYTQADRPLRKFQATNAFITAFPRYALEALGMVAIALFGAYL